MKSDETLSREIIDDVFGRMDRALEQLKNEVGIRPDEKKQHYVLTGGSNFGNVENCKDR